MEFSFHIQDPTNPNTVYLYEAIVKQLEHDDMVIWEGVFSFVTTGAVESLFVKDPAFRDRFLPRGEVDLLVGIDAVTDDRALSTFRDMNDDFGQFSAKVFESSSGLFHPKISKFYYDSGDLVLLIGSGNLTTGGLQKNTEAYSLITLPRDEWDVLSEWDEFLQIHKEHIREIDEDAIRKGESNRRRSQHRRASGREEEAVEDEIEEEHLHFPAQNRVLIAEVPKGGGRWHQIHYNKDIIKEFFGVQSYRDQRVFLQGIDLNGTLQDEEIRRVVYSESNRNPKIEASLRSDEGYPDQLPPVIVLKETGARNFNYTLLMPSDDGYDEVSELAHRHESIGRGLHRTITSYPNLLSNWDECPL